MARVSTYGFTIIKWNASRFRCEDCHDFVEHDERNIEQQDHGFNYSANPAKCTNSGKHCGFRHWRSFDYVVSANQRRWFTCYRLRNFGQRNSCLHRGYFNQLHQVERFEPDCQQHYGYRAKHLRRLERNNGYLRNKPTSATGCDSDTDTYPDTDRNAYPEANGYADG